MSTRATNARHVRQRKLNTRQPLRIIRENEVDEIPDDESQRHIPQVETGVEKGEEVEFHLQAAINAATAAALGGKTQQNYIPTPETIKAEGVKYDELYPKNFSLPATYIRFSSTVEDCVGVPYCMHHDDVDFLATLNDGKDVNRNPIKEKLSQCSEDVFEEVIAHFEDTSQRFQPFANADMPPLLSLEEMEQARDETLSADAQKFLKPIYEYWVLKKGSRPLMPAIKVRVLDTTNEADDSDPYVCFRRREVRQTRKTRGRDAQVVEKLKKLRLELEQARQLVQMVNEREELNKQNLEISRKVFEQRRQLKEVKITKNIIGEKGDDEELLVSQKPAPKPKARQDGSQSRPATLRLRSVGLDRAGMDNDLIQLADVQAQAEELVRHTIESRKEQHKRWNLQWLDWTWNPITPPPETVEETPKFAPLFPENEPYPTPPPSLPSVSSHDGDGDVEMHDQPLAAGDAKRSHGAGVDFFVLPPYPTDSYFGEDGSFAQDARRNANPACRLRYGRGGRCHMEMRTQKARAAISRGVVSDSDTDDELDEYYPVSDRIRFDYRCALGGRARPDGMSGERRQWPSGDQSALVAAAQAAAGPSQSPPQPPSAAGNGS